MIDLIINFWDVAVGLLIIVAVGVVTVIQFIKSPKSSQMVKIKEWLIWACLEAERQMGSKLGTAKLRWTYDLFIQRFPFMSKIISFEIYSSLVDEALITVRKMLESNTKAREYVNGEVVTVKAMEVKVLEGEK